MLRRRPSRSSQRQGGRRHWGRAALSFDSSGCKMHVDHGQLLSTRCFWKNPERLGTQEHSFNQANKEMACYFPIMTLIGTPNSILVSRFEPTTKGAPPKRTYPEWLWAKPQRGSRCVGSLGRKRHASRDQRGGKAKAKANLFQRIQPPPTNPPPTASECWLFRHGPKKLKRLISTSESGGT